MVRPWTELITPILLILQELGRKNKAPRPLTKLITPILIILQELEREKERCPWPKHMMGSKSLKSIMSIGTLTSVARVISFGIARLGGRLFTHLLSRFPSHYNKMNKGISIMGVLGLSYQSWIGTHLAIIAGQWSADIGTFSDPTSTNAILRSGVKLEHAFQLRHGFAAFSAYYQAKDKGKVVEIGNCEDVLTFENVFDSRVYNSIFHVGIFNLWQFLW